MPGVGAARALKEDEDEEMARDARAKEVLEDNFIIIGVEYRLCVRKERENVCRQIAMWGKRRRVADN